LVDCQKNEARKVCCFGKAFIRRCGAVELIAGRFLCLGFQKERRVGLLFGEKILFPGACHPE